MLTGRVMSEVEWSWLGSSEWRLIYGVSAVRVSRDLRGQRASARRFCGQHQLRAKEGYFFALVLANAAE